MQYLRRWVVLRRRGVGEWARLRPGVGETLADMTTVYSWGLEGI